jgi:serine/threonine protein kinase
VSESILPTASDRPSKTPTLSAGVAAGPLTLQPGGRPVPDYELVQVLGRGGFGEVWKAAGPGGFAVALKFVRLEQPAVAVETRSLQLMKDIRHPNLLATFGTWQREGFLIIAMELADGTLLDRLREAGAKGLPVEQLLEHMAEAAKGLDHLHSLGLQHRDIKPQNLLLAGGGVKVADFGLAKLLEHSLASNTGAMTPAYAAPEFLKGQTSVHSDQYSLAVSYCQLRGGRLPFTGDQAQILTGHLLRPPDLTMLPEAERPAVAKALAKKPDERWPSCRAFVQALAASSPFAAPTRVNAPAGLDVPSGSTRSKTVPPPIPGKPAAPAGSAARKPPPIPRAEPPSGRSKPPPAPGGKVRPPPVPAAARPPEHAPALGALARRPWATPVVEVIPQGGAAAVRGPAVVLLAVAAVSLLVDMAGFFLFLFTPAGEDLFAAKAAYLFVFGFGAVFSGYAAFAAALMLNCRGYVWALVGGIVSLFAIGPCCLFGLPVGLWAVLTLVRPEVRAAFH